MSTLAPLSSNSRGQLSSSPAGVTSWFAANAGAGDCARDAGENATAAATPKIRNELLFIIFSFIASPETNRFSLLLHNGCQLASVVQEKREPISFVRSEVHTSALQSNR